MNLTKNSLINSIFVLLSQISGFIRDVFIAAFLGSGIISNIFIIALRLPFSFQQSVSGETFNSAFIPTLSKIKGTNEHNKRHQFARNVLLIAFLFLVPFIIIAEINMSHILLLVAPGLIDSPEFDLLLVCSRITFPYISFIILSSIFAGLLNYKNKFSVTASLPIIVNLVIIFFIVISEDLSNNKVIALCWALLIGGLFQIALLMVSTEREFWKTSIDLKNNLAHLKKFFRLISPTFFSSTFLQINVLVGIIFASFYEGAVSYIYFADRVYMFPLTLTGISIATVLIPSLSSKIKINDLEGALSFQNKAYKLSIAAIFPATIILLMLSGEIIEFIYERGEFSPESTLNTAMVLKLFSLGLPAMCLSKILTPYFFAKENPTIPFRITTISVIINLCLTGILFQFIGFFSIPLSISITAFLTLYMYCLRHKKESFFLFSPEIIKHTLKYIIFCFILFIEIIGMKSLLYSYSFNSSSTLLLILVVCLLTYISFIKIYDKDLIEDIKGLMQNKSK